MSTRVLTVDDASAVDSLIEMYPFKPYRNYRVFARNAQNAILRAEIDATLRHPDGIIISDGAATLAAARTLAWDTQFFGIPMSRIEYVIAPSGEAAVAVIGATLDALRARGARHVSARVDVADIEVMAALESRGFRLVDALVTYTQRPRKEPAKDVRELGTIRPFQEGDGPELVRIAEEAYRGYRGRFHLDPHIPDSRCEAFYPEWARQCIAHTMADTILVSEGARGQLLGFLAYRRREPVSSVGGTPVFGGGLGACRRDAPGAYAGLIRAGTIWAHDRNGVAECQTQNYNFPVIRIYEAVGAHYVRAEYTLHCWLG